MPAEIRLDGCEEGPVVLRCEAAEGRHGLTDSCELILAGP